MRKLALPSLMFMLLCLSSCEAIGGIFKTGLYAGLVGAGVIIIFVIYLIIKYRGGSNR
ncbi:hypothetical protein MUGA111182_05465 [Mucilaginibacter galii]|uniref:hypothetical protein n=1 Tax=Mucilaginibacter galii TaxID=2005073 RepID=UPI00362D7267